LPYAPDTTSLLGALIENNNNAIGVVKDILGNNAYNDFSNNPNNKYTYVRIEDGPNIGKNPVLSHRESVDGAIEEKRRY